MMIGRNDPCWCGSGKKWKGCHYPEKGRPFLKVTEELRQEYARKYQVIIKNEQQITGIRRSCHLAARILEETCQQAAAGISTEELNAIAHRLCLEAGAAPASLNYGSPPFPKSICVSINEVVCHGIPGPECLKEGDIANIDFACILDGYFGDCSRMVTIGKVNEERQRVVDVSYESLMRSIAILKPGTLISEIGDVIEEYATAHHCSVVYQFIAHGVGVKYHEGPQILHCRNQWHIPVVPGMIFTIEPMINAGSSETIIDQNDHWTVRTVDDKPSAQWEHTVLITPDGHEILTPWKR